MTKLMEWLLFGILVLGSWLAVITGKLHSTESIEWYYLWFPVILLGLFGIYSVSIVMYRVFTFNNCEDAAEELKRQIKEARADLQAKGIKLKNQEL